MNVLSVIISNPPFLGGSRIRTEKGDDYVNFIKHRFPTFSLKADYSVLWIVKAIEVKPRRAGFVLPNNSISNNSRQMGLEKILATKGKIFFAIPPSSWSGSAAVFVAFVCFGWDPSLPDAFDARLNSTQQEKSSWSWEDLIAQQIPEDELRALSQQVEQTMIRIESYRKSVCMGRQIGLTTLYNEMLIKKEHPELRALHQTLDETVARLYNFPLEYLDDEDAIIDFLTQLNKKQREAC